MKKIIALLLVCFIAFSLTACGGDIGNVKDVLKDYLEQYETIEPDIKEDKENTDNDEDNEFNEDRNEFENEETIDGDNEPMYFENYNSFEVTFIKDNNSRFVCMPTTYFLVFDDGSSDVKTLTEVPSEVKPYELIELEIELMGNRTKAKIYNFYNEETISKDEAVLAYIEYKIQEDMDFQFRGELTEDSTKKDFYKVYGTPMYEDTKNNTIVICYKVPAANLGNQNGYLEFIFDENTQKPIEFRYGLFTPEYIEN